MLIRVDSREYIQASITADHDLVGRPIDVALPWAGYPPETWYRAEVTSISNPAVGAWIAFYRLLIGPGTSIVLAGGNYDWWVRVQDNPETPIRLAGSLQVRG